MDRGCRSDRYDVKRARPRKVPAKGFEQPLRIPGKPAITPSGSAIYDALSGNSVENALSFADLCSRWETLSPEAKAAILALARPAEKHAADA